jgi:peptide deformylase
VREEIMINPTIIAVSEQLESDEEWCLSLPWEQWSVQRPSWATIQWTDLKNKKQIRKVEWYNARVMLHEIDHLNWVLFIDKI